jgi:flavin-dependent dehydrogenase
MTEVYDFAAIGAGPAGESAAELAAFYGHRSVVIEKNRPGGTVTTTGGAPTKTLRDRLMPTMDGEMSRRMDDLFRMWGLMVVLGATADTITRMAPRILEVVLSSL